MARSPYHNLFLRLVANTEEPPNEQACWLWSGKTDRSGYGRVNVYHGGKAVTLMAHILAHVCMVAKPVDTAAAVDAYRSFTASGLELDHLCTHRACIYPDHLEPVTPTENCRRRDTRLALRRW